MTTDLMSVKKQVCWLRGLSTGFAFPPFRAVASEAFVARYSGATAQDLHLFVYSPLAVTGGTFTRCAHKELCTVKELSRLLVGHIFFVNINFERSREIVTCRDAGENLRSFFVITTSRLTAADFRYHLSDLCGAGFRPAAEQQNVHVVSVHSSLLQSRGCRFSKKLPKRQHCRATHGNPLR
jgi:hypothetical protein